ncbi:hypothetical protein LINPERHAP2_LOCUS11811 [Linum perenne]
MLTSVGRQGRVTTLRLTRMGRFSNPFPKRRRGVSFVTTWAARLEPL